MKVILLNGSPHKNGQTNSALSEVASSLVNEGIDADIFWVGSKPVSGCLGCGKCEKIHKCVINDRVNEFLDAAGKCDGFVFGTPVHWAAASGAITSFLDRVFYADLCGGLGNFYLKPAAAVTTARRSGCTATWDQLNKYFGLMQMPIITSQYWNMIFSGATPAESKNDAEGMQIMKTLGKNMAFFLKCKEAGIRNGIGLPHKEDVDYTNFIR